MENETIAGFHAALTRLVKAYQFRDRDRASCHGVTITQCYALAAIVERGPLTVNGLAAELCLNKSTASRVAEALEALGLVRREARGRSVELRPTPGGRGLHGRIERDLMRDEAAILGAYPEQSWAAVTPILHRLAERVAERTG